MRSSGRWLPEWEDFMTLPELLEGVLLFSHDRIGASSGSIMLLGETGSVDQMALAYANDVHTHSDAHHAEILRSGLAGWVVENRRAVLIPSTHDDPRWRLMEWEVGELWFAFCDQRAAGRPGACLGCIDPGAS